MKFFVHVFGLSLLLGGTPLHAAQPVTLAELSSGINDALSAIRRVRLDGNEAYRVQATAREAAFKASIVQGKWERRARVALDVAVLSALTVGCAAACYYFYPALLVDPRGMRPGRGGLASCAIVLAPILGFVASGGALKNAVTEGFTGHGPYVGSGIWKVRTKPAVA